MEGGVRMRRMLRRMLIADDDMHLRKLVSTYAELEGFQCQEAENAQEAIDLLDKTDFDILILDIMMPGKDGFEALAEIREHSQIPVIMLTARSEEYDKLLGFNLGADDYVSKPFSPKILVARVNALLRRTSGLAMDQTVSAGGIEIDKAAHIVKIDGNPVDLSFKEFELLTYFMENQGIALSREKILNNVWNYDYFGDARTIDTHVKKLRSKLGEKGEMIRTIWGMGYKFDPEEKGADQA